MKLIVRNNNIELDFSEPKDIQNKIKKSIHNTLDPLDSQRFHKMEFKRHLTDGRIKLCDLDNNLVPTGLFSDLTKLLDSISNQYHFKYSVVHELGKPLVPDKEVDYNTFTLKGENKPALSPRDYQAQAVHGILKEQRGIIDAGVGSGKSFDMYLTLYQLLPKLSVDNPFLVIAPNVSIMKQLYGNFKAYLGAENIGIWGNGQKVLNKPIVIATIQTIYSACKEPEMQVKTAKEKRIKRFVETYIPKIDIGINVRPNLALYIKNFVPIYKYEVQDKEILKKLYSETSSSRDIKREFKKLEREYEKMRKSKIGSKLKKYDEAVSFLNKVVGVFCDECQGCASDSYHNTFKHLKNARIRIGFTGSVPKERDRFIKIKALFGDIISSVKIDEMQTRGFNAHLNVRLLEFDEPKDLDIQVEKQMMRDNVPKYQRDLYRYQKEVEIGIVHNQKRNNLIAQLAVKIAEKEDKENSDLALLMLVNSLEHGELLCDELAKLGYTKYAFVQGKDDAEQRDLVLNDARTGNLRIVIATRIFEAGIDVSNFKYMINVRGSKSYVGLIQQIGRILRTKDNKKDVYYYDIVDRQGTFLFKHAQERIRYYKQENFNFLGGN